MKINCTYSELVDIHKVVPNPKNPNKHPKDQIQRLAKIIDYSSTLRNNSKQDRSRS